jgi:hypothetical protein
MNVQVFKPIETVIADNLFKKSTFDDLNAWDAVDYYYGLVKKGTVDETKNIDNCKALKTENGEIFQIQYIEGLINETKTLTFSIMIQSSDYNSCEIYFYYVTKEPAQGHEDAIFASVPKPTITNSYQKVSVSIALDPLVANWSNKGCGFWIRNNVDTWVCQPKLEYGVQATPYCPSIYDVINYDYYSKYNASFQSVKVGDIQDVTDYSYTKCTTEVGTFTMSIPIGTPYADEIAEDYYLFVDKEDWLLAQDINVTDTSYEISGVDLKGLLGYRCTIAPTSSVGEMLFDTVEGPTETCCKHYVFTNVINPSDSNRIIPLVTIAEDKKRGKSNDNYTSRLDNLDEVIKKLCDNANIYYDMTADLMNNKIIFDVKEYVDKTVNQNERNRVIFKIEYGNIASIVKTTGVSTYKNAFYATRQVGENEENPFVVEQYWTSTQPKGVERKEKVLSVSCDNDEDISKYAIFGMLDYYKIDSIEVIPSDVENYGKLYELGDKVTIIFENSYIDTVINQVEKTYSQGTYSINLGFGNAKPKPLEYLNRKIKNKGV